MDNGDAGRKGDAIPNGDCKGGMRKGFVGDCGEPVKVLSESQHDETGKGESSVMTWAGWVPASGKFARRGVEGLQMPRKEGQKSMVRLIWTIKVWKADVICFP
jgi:hypothetical protein